MPERRARIGLSWPIAVVAALVVLPGVISAVGSGYAFRLVELGLISAVLAASLNLIMGSAGLVSLGHAAFYAVGAYTTAIIATSTHAGLLLTLPASLLSAGVLGAIVAIPMIRLLRVFFTVATLAVGEIANIIFTNWDALTGGPNGFRGIPPFSVAGITLSGRLATYDVIALVSLAALWCVHRLMRSPYGKALRALREDEASAGAMGISTRRLKISVLAIGGGLAGGAGCLTAHSTGFISPDMFRLDQSILILAMVVLGGLGSLPGAVAGAFVLSVGPELIRTAGHFRMALVGVLLFGSILLLPRGLLSEEWFLRPDRRLVRWRWWTRRRMDTPAS